MKHYMTITYTYYNLFSRKDETVVRNYIFNWIGVQNALHSTYYREHNATFKLATYHGQKADN